MGRADIKALLPFLDYGFGHPWPPIRWLRLFNYPGVERAPNLGFVLESGGRVVGFLGAIYHERFIESRVERFCNLTSWYVQPEFRSHSLALLTALLRQPDYNFVNFTPSDVVSSVMTRFGFHELDTHKLLFARWPYHKIVNKALLAPSNHHALISQLLTLDKEVISKVAESRYYRSAIRLRSGSAEFSYRSEEIRPQLSRIEQRLLDDHPRCCHFLLRMGKVYLYLITKNRQLILKSCCQMPLIATDLLHLSSTDIAHLHWPLLCDLILQYSGSHAITIDGRSLATTSGIGLRVPCHSYFRPRSRGSTLVVDGLYSEITCLDLPIFA